VAPTFFFSTAYKPTSSRQHLADFFSWLCQARPRQLLGPLLTRPPSLLAPTAPAWLFIRAALFPPLRPQLLVLLAPRVDVWHAFGCPWLSAVAAAGAHALGSPPPSRSPPPPPATGTSTSGSSTGGSATLRARRVAFGLASGTVWRGTCALSGPVGGLLTAGRRRGGHRGAHQRDARLGTWGIQGWRGRCTGWCRCDRAGPGAARWGRVGRRSSCARSVGPSACRNPLLHKTGGCAAVAAVVCGVIACARTAVPRKGGSIASMFRAMLHISSLPILTTYSGRLENFALWESSKDMQGSVRGIPPACKRQARPRLCDDCGAATSSSPPHHPVPHGFPVGRHRPARLQPLYPSPGCFLSLLRPTRRHLPAVASVAECTMGTWSPTSSEALAELGEDGLTELWLTDLPVHRSEAPVRWSCQVVHLPPWHDGFCFAGVWWQLRLLVLFALLFPSALSVRSPSCAVLARYGVGHVDLNWLLRVSSL